MSSPVSDPFFTVIVPVYKAEAYLEDSISSVLGQTFGDFELWLIDDGSPDGSGRICDQIARQDPRVHVHHQTNQGPSSARNYGLEHARGKYVCFMDADDRVKPDWLNAYHQHADADVLIQGVEIVAEDGTVTVVKAEEKVYRMEEGGKYKILKEVPGICTVSVWSKSYLRELFVVYEIKFDETLSRAEDRIFSIKCFSLCHTARTIDYAGYYYQRSNSFLTNIDYSVKDMLSVRQQVIKNIDENFAEEGDKTARLLLYSWEVMLLISVLFQKIFITPRQERYAAYRWLRKYFPYIDYSQYGKSIQVFRFLWLPDPIFDILLLTSIRVKPALKKAYYTLKPKK